MGCAYSAASQPFKLAGPMKKNIRVVHLNGFVEVFDYPVSVGDVTGGKPSAGFVCTPSQLLCSHSKPLMPENTALQPGHIYLLLPFSTLQSDLSPVDLATIARRLTAKAKSAKSRGKKSCRSSGRSSCSPMRSSVPTTAASPSRGAIDPAALAISTSCRAGRSPWRPILDTIREKSFNRSSESELNISSEKYGE